MGPIWLPAIAGLAWLVHAGFALSGRPRAGLRLAVLIGLPVAALACYAAFSLAYPHRAGLKIYEKPPGANWLANAVLGFVLWAVLLALEPVLLLIARTVQQKRSVHLNGSVDQR
jgi:hypothetical protein